jgi:hypothetical protein
MVPMGAWRDQIDPTPMIFPPGAIRNRWYRNHAMASEDLWVVAMGNQGRLGTLAGRVVVAREKHTLVNFCTVNYVNGEFKRLALPEGTRIHRLTEAPKLDNG